MENCFLSDSLESLSHCFVNGLFCPSVQQFASLALSQDEYYFTDEERELCLLYLEEYVKGFAG